MRSMPTSGSTKSGLMSLLRYKKLKEVTVQDTSINNLGVASFQKKRQGSKLVGAEQKHRSSDDG